MAEPLSPSQQSGASFRSEWPALLECASPSRNRQRLRGLLRSVDQALFETAETRCQMAGHAVFFREGEQASPIRGPEQHGVAGHLAASLRGLEEGLIPPETR